MRKIQEIFNFDNIGEKIKSFTKWSCWITILLTWIGAAIIFLVFLFTDGMFLFALLVPVGTAIYSLLIWVGSWTLYAFGEYVENIRAIKNQTSMIYNIDKNLQIIAQPTIDETKEKIKHEKEERIKQQAEEKAKREEEERSKHKADTPPTKIENNFTEKSWVCGKCKTRNLNIRNDCWSCGNPK